MNKEIGESKIPNIEEVLKTKEGRESLERNGREAIRKSVKERSSDKPLSDLERERYSMLALVKSYLNELRITPSDPSKTLWGLSARVGKIMKDYNISCEEAGTTESEMAELKKKESL